MSPLPAQKTAAIVALVATALIDRQDPRTTMALLLFGIANIVLPSPATLWTRTATVLAVMGAFLAQSWQMETTIIVLLAIFWPPAFLIEWTLRRDHLPDAATPFGTSQHARMATAGIIAAAAIASVQYRWLFGQGLQQSAALFVGIPALLSIVIVFAVSPQTATGVASKAVTIVLLMSLIFLWEGALCVVMSAPLFFLVAIGIGKSIDNARDDKHGTISLRAAVPVLVIIVMSLEGVFSATSFDREESITVTRIVHAPSDVVARVVSETPRFERALPRLLQAGFPTPIATHFEQTGAGTRLIVAFRGGEMRLNGMEPRTGDLTLDLVESQPGLARWEARSDDSHMTHFLAWRGSTVRWSAVAPVATRVEWTLHYRRSLDPAWYFGPMERFAVTLAAGYLIDAVATP